MIVVADTSPPLHLARIRRLDLVPAVVGRVTIPHTVWTELVQLGTRPDVIATIQTAHWIEVVEDPIVQDLGLDPGETAAILLAEKLGAKALLIDERRGRFVAGTRGIAVIGTLRHRGGRAENRDAGARRTRRGGVARRRLLAFRCPRGRVPARTWREPVATATTLRDAPRGRESGIPKRHSMLLIATRYAGARRGRHRRPRSTWRVISWSCRSRKSRFSRKGARVTSHVSLPGCYIVYLPTVDHPGISKRIGSARERQRLRQVMESLKPARGGLIVRTVAEGLTKKQLKADVGYLIRVWAEVCKKRETARASEELYTELDLVLKVARDLFTDEVKSIVIDGRIVPSRRDIVLASRPDSFFRARLIPSNPPMRRRSQDLVAELQRARP
jgi:predicted nucleic acid-binding protein